MQQEHTDFLLEPTCDALEHDCGAPSYGFFQILYREGKVKEDLGQVSKLEMFETDRAKVEKLSYQTLCLSSPFSKDPARYPAIFVSLGRLVKIESVTHEKGKRQTTNYVVLLNLTTDRISVWLMYDYHTPPDDAYPFTRLNALEDYRHPDPYFLSQEAVQVPRLVPRTGSTHQVLLDNSLYKSFRSKVLGIEDQCLVSPLSKVAVIPGVVSVAKSGRKLKSTTGNRASNDSHTTAEACSLGSDRKQSMLVVNGNPKGKTTNTNLNGIPANSTLLPATSNKNTDDDLVSSNCNCKGGLFDQIHPFDLALLAPDWATWSLKGLNSADTMKWIANSHVRLGSSMRVFSMLDEKETYEQTDTKVVDFTPLCGPE